MYWNNKQEGEDNTVKSGESEEGKGCETQWIENN